MPIIACVFITQQSILFSAVFSQESVFSQMCAGVKMTKNQDLLEVNRRRGGEKLVGLGAEL